MVREVPQAWRDVGSGEALSAGSTPAWSTHLHFQPLSSASNSAGARTGPIDAVEQVLADQRLENRRACHERRPLELLHGGVQLICSSMPVPWDVSGRPRRLVRPYALACLSTRSFVSRPVAYSSNARRTSGARSASAIRTFESVTEFLDSLNHPNLESALMMVGTGRCLDVRTKGSDAAG